MKKEAERKEAERQRQIQAEKEREWERTRPQREAQERKQRQAQEAEARKQQEAEKKRLAGLCPIYYLARQTCATAPNYDGCMNIRLNNSYSSWDDRACFNR